MKINFPIIGCAVLMASCSGIYKNYERPQALAQGVDSLYRNTTTDVVKADTANYGNTPWQEVFTDPQLQALINTALANNTNLLNADLSIQQIQAGLKMHCFPTTGFHVKLGLQQGQQNLRIPDSCKLAIWFDGFYP